MDYVKTLPWEPHTCTLGWTFKRKLNATIRELYWIFLLERKISIMHLTNHINLNDASRWAGKNLWRIFHAISWNILNIFVCHVEILCDMAKYSMASHGIFCHITCVVCSKINNGLLTLNVWVWSIELLKITSCEDLETKKIEGYILSSLIWCNQCSKCLGFLDNNYNIFKNVEIGGNCMVEKIWWSWNTILKIC